MMKMPSKGETQNLMLHFVSKMNQLISQNIS